LTIIVVENEESTRNQWLFFYYRFIGGFV